MGIMRAATQRLLRSRALNAAAIVGGWLRLDRAFDAASRWVGRKRIRMLAPWEIHEAERVFGGSIPYEKVRVYEASPLASRIAAVSGRVHLPQDSHLGVTVFYTVHFSRALRPHNADMPWLIHELTHVWQYCRYGPRYMTQALRVQSQLGHQAYDITRSVTEGLAWADFNAEQQGDVARAYYKALVSGDDVSVYQPYIDILCSFRM